MDIKEQILIALGLNKEEKEPKMQDSFDRAERKWSDSVN